MASKILFLDIETKPAVVATFGIRDQHIGHKQILIDGGVICVGMKWLADKKATVYSDWEHGHKEMLQIVHAALEEAEAVATYNGASFDLPKLQGEFLLHGLPPAPQLTQIDIYRSVRKLGYICNKLDYVAQILGLGSKVKHEGLDLWLKVMDGDEAAQRRMTKYCAGDVMLTEKVYKHVRAFIHTHPHMGATKPLDCGACGSSRTQARGWHRTKASIRQRYQCQACGTWSLGNAKRV
jgi:uncharacterized protein YprB with RNaseH-like and TPR domain